MSDGSEEVNVLLNLIGLSERKPHFGPRGWPDFQTGSTQTVHFIQPFDRQRDLSKVKIMITRLQTSLEPMLQVFTWLMKKNPQNR
jgi:hypothetical protein